MVQIASVGSAKVLFLIMYNTRLSTTSVNRSAWIAVPSRTVTLTKNRGLGPLGGDRINLFAIAEKH